MQPTTERRSARVAAQRAARAATQPPQEGAVGTAVAKAEERIASALTRGRGRGGGAGRGHGGRGNPDPRSRGQKRSRGGEDPTGRDGPSSAEDEGANELEVESSDSSASDSSKESSKDPATLRKLWMYTVTKEHYADTLPTPFKLNNPQVVKDPVLWGLLWDMMGVTSTAFVTEHELDGDLTRAFEVALETAYLTEHGGPLAISSSMIQLKNFWKMLASVYFNAPDPKDVLEGPGRLIIQGARRVLQDLGAMFLTQVFGSSAGQAFRHASKVQLKSFSKASAKAVRAAIKAGKHSPSTGSKEKSRRCSKCGEHVGFKKGAFLRHNPRRQKPTQFCTRFRRFW